jgi:hypothetical protein
VSAHDERGQQRERDGQRERQEELRHEPPTKPSGRKTATVVSVRR